MDHTLAIGKRYGSSWWYRQKPITTTAALNPNLLCIGQPGSGKSYFLCHQALQDVRAHNGFIFLNPHPETTDNLFRALITFGWLPEDVILLDPSNLTYGSPGLNVLECESGQQIFEPVDEIGAALKVIFADSWGERTANLYRQTFLALAEAHLTFADAPLFLSDSAFRHAVLSHVTNEDVRLFWLTHFDALKPFEQNSWVESPLNKLSAFLSSPYLKPIFSQHQSTITIAEAMNQGKAILVNLSQNHLKETRKLFGALVLAKLSLAILSREHLLPEQRRFCTLYCDENHEYFLPHFCLMIAAGARKYALGYRVFSQSLAQYRPEDIDTLFSCCAIQCAFNLSEKDASRFARELFAPSGNRFIKSQERDLWGPKGHPTCYSISEELQHAVNQLTTQRQGECYIRIRGKDDTGDPYIATVPPVTFPPPDPDTEAAFREASAQVYCRPLQEIEHERQQRLARFLAPSPRTITNRS